MWRGGAAVYCAAERQLAASLGVFLCGCSTTSGLAINSGGHRKIVGCYWTTMMFFSLQRSKCCTAVSTTESVFEIQKRKKVRILTLKK
ncbi:hypothetical protein QBC35DRAFT_61671 [Podospora australis]|uniref:Uncharacterized protein n=1 Tax=Podospora australis TaxID=1536484 RepID=A0AAN6WYN9_9PEZI|nr:hypothetical protein QBC35DRAFT_61671 [Podospora australis]